MVDYIRSDLEFILEQIKIAEAHAAGTPLYGPGGLIPTYNIAWGLRTVDGSYNHLLPGQEYWGAADQPFPNHSEPEYRTIMVDPDGDGPMGPMPVTYTPGVDNDGPGPADPSDVFDPYVRMISNLIVDQTLTNPAAIIVSLDRNGVEGDLVAIAGQIKLAYEQPMAAFGDQSIEDLFKTVDDATDANADAQAAAAVNPTVENLAAAEAALAALTAAETELADARAFDPDGAGEALSFDALLGTYGVELSGANVVLPNVAPDEGLSAPFNSWFTFFGQFFDHGLDLVAKGGDGEVFIPLMPDDPLYVEGSSTNFMILTRATIDESGQSTNLTTPYVDQNQTYSSHPSHQVFLREYEMGADGPEATGDLIHGVNGGMATWGQLKEQARTMLGIDLRDTDVGNLPLLRTDQYGTFIPGANGLPQVVIGIGVDGIPNTADDVVVEGDLDNPLVLAELNGGAGPVRTGHAFLDDIAHNAVPDGLEDGDTEVGGNIPADGEYDDELLDAHYVAGDGRANENVGLTAVHHVFHAEHNRLVQHTKDVTIADAQQMLADGASQEEAVAFLNEWLDVPVTEVPTTGGEIAALDWNGDRIFQAAKFGTEMQYQHLVFEEFARKIQPSINGFLVPDGFDTTMDPSIMGEFAHVVYRFGHSMLTETIDRYDSSFEADHISLIEGFLNPLQFDPLDPDAAAGDIIRGMTRQVGNHIDEFVTSALRNNLLGLPLDLATINLARGRDTGVPTLNEARRQFYEATDQNQLLEPYESWTDFAGHLKNEASIINFIAAYGTHELITSQTTAEGRRDAALTIITGESFGGMEVPTDRLDFLNAQGDYAGGRLGGLEDVDMWIGGLAEETMPFGGMLGSTFGFVFEVQLEALQSGDRFYYLQRLDGLHLFGEMENNSFAAMISRNTDAMHLPSDVFSAPTWILEVNQALQRNDVDGDGVFETDDPEGSGILTQLVIRDNPGTVGPDSNYLRYTGGDHVVLGGTEANDILRAGIGDDTLYGDGGNDRLEGDFGNDIINGGAGDDIITDRGGDDNIKGGDGNDAIHAGPGLDLILAGRGQDFVVLGTDEGSEVFGGEGDDFIYGNKNAERILGNEGNDWLETGTFDGAPGDNFDEVFARDGVDGHDVFLGDGGFDEFIGEGGDDIMVGSPGRGKMVGMSGFDWATYKDNTSGVNADLSIPIIFDEAPNPPENASLDEFESMEGLSGSAFDDILTGTNDVAADRAPLSEGGTTGYLGSRLDAEGIALINGLQQVLGIGVTSFDGGDIILGGDGSDLITGGMGDDIIDGDKWLDVQIGVFAPGDDDHSGEPISLHDSMTELTESVFSGAINPGQLSIVRTIRSADGSDDTDVAGFSGAFVDYDISFNDDGTVTVSHARGTQNDGSDTLRNIELLRFADQDFNLLTGSAIISDLTPTAGQILTVDASSISVLNGGDPLSYQWRSSANGISWTDIAGATAASFTPADAAGMLADPQRGLLLSVAVSLTDGSGTTFYSAPTAPVGANWVGDGNANTFLGTHGDDIASGEGGADTLAGYDGSDVLNGGAGNDVLVGGEGVDQLTGGTGNDIIYVDNVADVVVENAGEGTDTVVAGANYVLAAGVSVERMAMFGGSTGTVALNLTGNELAQRIVGNAAANTLNGGAGNDILVGWGGVDTLIGGTGNDIMHVDNAGDVVVENAGEGTDTVVASADYVLASGVSVERMQTSDGAGGSADIDLTGNELDQRITGNAAANTLIGGAGNDTLFGGAGVDQLIGGTGNDIIYVDDAADVVTETAGEGTDTVIAGADYALAAGASVERLTMLGGTTGTAAFSLTGNELAQRIVGNGGANTLNGGGGDDVIVAWGGDDTIVQASTDGRDVIDGMDGVDTYVLNGDATAEAFSIMTRDAAVTAGFTGLLAATEIVIVRNGSVISELDNIEEITVNTLAVSENDGNAVPNSGESGGDTITVVGDFSTTSLDYSTITVNGGAGIDMVDISGLSSDHRLVFNTNDGDDGVVGELRPQDEVNATAASAPPKDDWTCIMPHLEFAVKDASPVLPSKGDWRCIMPELKTDAIDDGAAMAARPGLLARGNDFAPPQRFEDDFASLRFEPSDGFPNLV